MCNLKCFKNSKSFNHRKAGLIQISTFWHLDRISQEWLIDIKTSESLKTRKQMTSKWEKKIASRLILDWKQWALLVCFRFISCTTRWFDVSMEILEFLLWSFFLSDWLFFYYGFTCIDIKTRPLSTLPNRLCIFSWNILGIAFAYHFMALYSFCFHVWCHDYYLSLQFMVFFETEIRNQIKTWRRGNSKIDKGGEVLKKISFSSGSW